MDIEELKGIDVTVEMLAFEIGSPKYLLPPPPSHLDHQRLEEKWPIIRANVGNILESFSATASHVWCIAIFIFGNMHRGFGFGDLVGPESNTKYEPHTVYVLLDHGSNEAEWPPLQSTIQAYLDDLDFTSSLEVHFEHGTLHQLAQTRLFPYKLAGCGKYRLSSGWKTYIHYVVKPSARLGAATYIKRADGELRPPPIGTLGCYLEILKPGSPTWTKVGLTSYQAVRPALEGFRLGARGPKGWQKSTVIECPAEGSPLSIVDSEELKPDVTWPSTSLIEHPPKLRGNFSHDMYNNFDRHSGNEFASLWAASRYGRRGATTNCRLDWALIKPLDSCPQRDGDNTFPNELPRPDNDREDRSFASSLQPPCLANLKVGDKLYSFETDYVAGRFITLRADIMVIEEEKLACLGRPIRPSTEYLILRGLAEDHGE
ncbi:hypothetical protein QBC38DRAFT_524771 [Podospora fimiseda]|uniref:Uncharacterized protein n=1 Tax=Podospora fimiseda TaxID=252190 RepID=A0AAN6YK83_9PEZI|nr:hypothetical protein QBC38DRAFT_524771 [Podospora fimiseda]